MKRIIICVGLQLSWFAAFTQETPSAKELFSKVKTALNSIKTLSYETELRRYNSGIDDSITFYKGSIWLRAMPADTIFQTHFHVASQGPNGNSDYYYDGTNGIDIWHTHRKSKESEKSITVIEPQQLGNDYNRVQARTSVMPYFNELTSTKALAKWFEKDSITIKEDALKKHWIVEWPENSLKDNFFAIRQIYIDKASNLIKEMHRKSNWNGTKMAEDLYINKVVVNNPATEENISLKQTYPDYKTTYVSNKSENKPVEMFSFAGQKAKDFSYPSFTGQAVSLKAAKRKFLLLDFWETWCGYCYLAMPRLKDLHEKYKAQGLEIVGVVTENKTGVQQVINTQKFPYPTIYADQKLLDGYKVEGRPTYLLIDDKGMIVEHSIGSLDKIEKSIIERMRK